MNEGIVAKKSNIAPEKYRVTFIVRHHHRPVNAKENQREKNNNNNKSNYIQGSCHIFGCLQGFEP